MSALSFSSVLVPRVTNSSCYYWSLLPITLIPSSLFLCLLIALISFPTYRSITPIGVPSSLFYRLPRPNATTWTLI
jgi:hypothetical protein